jgi:hypothetical protein
MKLTSSLLAALLGASSTSAAAGTLTAGRDISKSRRSIPPDQKQSTPAKFLNQTAAHGRLNGTDIETSNWSGAFVNGTGINYARGTWVVPTPKEAPGVDPTDQSVGVWVGIGEPYFLSMTRLQVRRNATDHGPQTAPTATAA